MGARSGETWAQLVGAFRAGPGAFLAARGPDEPFLPDVLQDLGAERLSEQTKLSLLSLLLEFPALLCPDPGSGEAAGASLLAAYSCLPARPAGPALLRQHLLLAAGTVLLCSDAFGPGSRASRDYASLLLHLASDLNDQRQGPGAHGLRLTALECLRELETCCPGLLARRLDSLRSMQRQETSPAHQAYALLYSLALRNAVLGLARRGHGGLADLLASNEGLAWEATSAGSAVSPGEADRLELLAAPGETKELRSVLSPLLEASALLSPVAQAHVLWQLAQAVGVIRTQSPAVFKAPLVRLFGTAHAALLHASLRLKALFTDSLFTAEDEAFLLRRLVALAGHPALPSPLRLFYLDCLLCFPENRPLGSEGIPVLLTPRLAASLVPSIFQDPGTVLARYHLFSLVCLENPGPEAERGAGVLFEQLLALAGVVAGWGAVVRGGASEGGWDLRSGGVQDGGPGVGWDRGSAGVQDWGSMGGRGAREAVVLFFRSAYLFVRYFGSQAGRGLELAAALARLYSCCPALAPHFLNLLAETRAALDDPAWPAALAGALQELIVSQAPQPRDLPWHLRVLSHVAGAPGVPAGAAASYVQRLACLARAGRLGGWRPGQALLGVCRTLLQRPGGAGPPLAALLEELAWGYPDVDVQHQARFYRALLASLGAEKLGAVLAPAGRLQARTLSSSLVAESESFTAALTVHPAPHVPLRLERQALPAAGAPLRACGVAEAAAEISAPAAPLPLNLGYRVLHAGDPPEPLLCLLLRFEASGSYGPVPDIHVPCLRAGHPPPTLTLQLQPQAPYPTRVAVTALYSTPAGLTYSCRLEPLEVSFPDLFQPLALPPDWDLPTRRQLFRALWDALGPGSESLVSWARLRQPVASLVERVFGRYLVAPGSGACEVGLALPPRHRVLLQAREAGGRGAACVALRTDHWGALPLLGKYLREVGGEGG